MRIAPLIALLLLTTGCEQSPPPLLERPPRPIAGQDVTPRDAHEAAVAAACPASGGWLQRDGLAGGLICVVAYADAGKVCTDGSQCQGRQCRAEPRYRPWPQSLLPTNGRCVATNNPFGCYSALTRGRLRGGICVD